jgi:hypothetical protein
MAIVIGVAGLLAGVSATAGASCSNQGCDVTLAINGTLTSSSYTLGNGQQVTAYNASPEQQVAFWISSGAVPGGDYFSLIEATGSAGQVVSTEGTNSFFYVNQSAPVGLIGYELAVTSTPMQVGSNVLSSGVQYLGYSNEIYLDWTYQNQYVLNTTLASPHVSVVPGTATTPNIVALNTNQYSSVTLSFASKNDSTIQSSIPGGAQLFAFGAAFDCFNPSATSAPPTSVGGCSRLNGSSSTGGLEPQCTAAPTSGCGPPDSQDTAYVISDSSASSGACPTGANIPSGSTCNDFYVEGWVLGQYGSSWYALYCGAQYEIAWYTPSTTTPPPPPPPPPPPSSGIITLSANPTSLSPGNSTTLTAVTNNVPVTYEYWSIYICQTGGSSTSREIGVTANEPASARATWSENSDITDTFVAYIGVPGVTCSDSSGMEVASNAVQVTWQGSGQSVPCTLCEMSISTNADAGNPVTAEVGTQMNQTVAASRCYYEVNFNTGYQVNQCGPNLPGGLVWITGQNGDVVMSSSCATDCAYVGVPSNLATTLQDSGATAYAEASNWQVQMDRPTSGSYIGTSVVSSSSTSGYGYACAPVSACPPPDPPESFYTFSSVASPGSFSFTAPAPTLVASPPNPSPGQQVTLTATDTLPANFALAIVNKTSGKQLAQCTTSPCATSVTDPSAATEYTAQLLPPETGAFAAPVQTQHAFSPGTVPTTTTPIPCTTSCTSSQDWQQLTAQQGEVLAPQWLSSKPSISVTEVPEFGNSGQVILNVCVGTAGQTGCTPPYNIGTLTLATEVYVDGQPQFCFWNQPQCQFQVLEPADTTQQLTVQAGSVSLYSSDAVAVSNMLQVGPASVFPPAVQTGTIGFWYKFDPQVQSEPLMYVGPASSIDSVFRSPIGVPGLLMAVGENTYSSGCYNNTYYSPCNTNTPPSDALELSVNSMETGSGTLVSSVSGLSGWHFIAVTLTSGAATLYVDGQPVGSANWSPTAIPSPFGGAPAGQVPNPGTDMAYPIQLGSSASTTVAQAMAQEFALPQALNGSQIQTLESAATTAGGAGWNGAIQSVLGSGGNWWSFDQSAWDGPIANLGPGSAGALTGQVITGVPGPFPGLISTIPDAVSPPLTLGQPIVLTLQAAPTTPTVGNSTTLTVASSQPVGSGCVVYVDATPADPNGSWTNPVSSNPASNQAQASGSDTWTTNYSLAKLPAGISNETITYQASLVCSGVTVTQSNQVPVLWTAQVLPSGPNHPT